MTASLEFARQLIDRAETGIPSVGSVQSYKQAIAILRELADQAAGTSEEGVVASNLLLTATRTMCTKFQAISGASAEIFVLYADLLHGDLQLEFKEVLRNKTSVARTAFVLGLRNGRNR